MNNKESPLKKAEVLVFAAERVGLTVGQTRVDERNYNITFAPFETKRAFHEFDGVVVFQRTFESFNFKHSGYREYLEHTCFRDELDRRMKEADELRLKGGFICFVLWQPLLDYDDGKDYRTTDLVKRYLFAGRSFEREDLNSRIIAVSPATGASEFDRFLRNFGAASTRFSYSKAAASEYEIRRLATLQDFTVGMMIGPDLLFVPSLIPTWSDKVEHEFFSYLVDAVVALVRKVRVSLPNWAQELRFAEENSLLQRKSQLSEQLAKINDRFAQLERMKQALVADSIALIGAVAFIFEHGLGFQTDVEDDFREDLKLLSDDRTQILALCEIKGSNRGLKREHINQADSHRERSVHASDFPTILIVNVGIKSARSLLEKDIKVEPEHIQHAARNKILVLRTLDLLYLARHKMAGTANQEELRNALLNGAGWLMANENDWIIKTA